MLIREDALAAIAGFAGLVSAEELNRVVFDCGGCLPASARPRSRAGAAADVAEKVLLEGQFGSDHFCLSRAKRVYYRLRPFAGRSARAVLRRRVVRSAATSASFGWPIEARFVDFIDRMSSSLVDSEPSLAALRRPWWPEKRAFSLVLTHDVESSWGVNHVRDLMDLEEGLGLRSSIHFVGSDYSVPRQLLEECIERGFELGIHGWRHDGRLFSSESSFAASAARINSLALQWDVRGFRSPMTHRDPQWMQELDILWDSSFFDTDPFEPIPGGVMTLWPYLLGHFVELPYTMPQDHTLLETLHEDTPRIWFQKLEFIANHHGMALLNTHPDYLCRGGHLSLYSDFLKSVAGRCDCWHALPSDVARWVRQRWSRLA